MIERNIDTAINVLGAPLAWIPDVQQERRIRARQLFRHHRGTDAIGRPYQVGSLPVRCHAPCQIAFDGIEADTAKAQRSLLLASGLGNDDDGLGAIENGSSPRGVLSS